MTFNRRWWTMADNVMKYKYIVKNVASRHGKTATFMPKPLFGDNGSGMHVHSSLWKSGSQPVRRLRLRRLVRNGHVRHRRPAQACPGSVRLLQPDDQQLQAPGPRLRGAGQSRVQPSQSVGVDPHPGVQPSPKAKRLEFRCPDPSCNPYLSFSAMLMAMLDGIKNKINPGEPLDKDIYDLEPEELAKVPKAPGSLEEAISNLERTTSSCCRATSSPRT